MASSKYNLQSKHERAVAAYLVGKGCGSIEDVLPFQKEEDRIFPNTTINTGICVPEVNYTGIFRIPTIVSIQGSAALDPNETDLESPRLAFDQRVALTGDMLMQTADQQTLKATAEDITAAGRALAVAVDSSLEAVRLAADNADMVDYTCMGWFEKGFGKGEAKQEGCSWEIVLLYEAVCCAKNVD